MKHFKYLALDTETTGLDPFSDRIVSAALAEPNQTKEWLINPGIPISSEASAINGLTDEDVANAMHPADALREIANMLKEVEAIVAFNAAYDCTLLDQEFQRWEIPTADLYEKMVLDPLLLDRVIMPHRRGKRTLTALCKYYEIDANPTWHTAGGDAKAAQALFQEMESYFRDFSLKSLHELQAETYDQWMDYLEGVGKTVNRGWPFQS